MSPELIARVLDELEGCDFARFSAAGSSTDELHAAAGRVRTLVDRVRRWSATPHPHPPDDAALDPSAASGARDPKGARG